MTPDALTDRIDAAAPPPAAGVWNGPVFRFPIRVYYEDTDAGGVVYHANHIRFAERARTEMLRSLGVDQRTLYAERRVAFAVGSLAVDYRRPARLDDLLVVETSVGRVGGSAMELVQRMRRDGAEVAVVTVRIVCVGPDWRATRLPDDLRAAIAARLATDLPPTDPRTPPA